MIRWPRLSAVATTRRRWASSPGPGSTAIAAALPGSAISQVFVPSRVIIDGFGASTQNARSVRDPSTGPSG